MNRRISIPSIALLLWLAATVFARQPVANLHASPLQSDDPTIYYEDSKSKELLAKAQGFEARGAWKEAILWYMKAAERYPDDLHPVDEQGRLVLAGGEAAAKSTVRRSVSEYVFRKLSALPPPALKIYREELGFDAKARMEFEKARNENNIVRLEFLIDKYFPASMTDEAIDYLANTYIENGKTADALFHLKRLLNSYPDSNIPRGTIVAKIAFLSAMTPKLETELKYAGDMSALGKEGGEVISTGAVHITVRDFIKELSAALAPNADLQGKYERKLPKPILSPQDVYYAEPRAIKGEIRRWSSDDLMVGTKAGSYAQIEGMELPSDYYRNLGPARSFIPAYADINGKKYLFAQNGFDTMALNPSNGKLYWSTSAISSAPKEDRQGQRQRQPRPVGPIVFSCIVDGEDVVVNCYTDRAGLSRSSSPMTIRAIQARTGKLLWDIRDANANDKAFDDLLFASPPIVSGNKVYAAATTSGSGEQEVYLLLFDRGSGALLKKIFLCAADAASAPGYANFSMRAPPSIVCSGGVIYCQTNIGNIAAISGTTGNILWVSEYKRRRSEGDNRLQRQPSTQLAVRSIPGPPIVFRNFVYVLPSDSSNLIVMMKENGKVLRDDLLDKPYFQCHLVDISMGFLYIAGSDLLALDLREKDKPKILRSAAPTSGRGFVSNGYYYAACADAMVIFEPATWKILAEKRWDADDAGNIILAGDSIISQSPTGKLVCFANYETVQREFAAKIRQDPVSVDAIGHYADMMLKNGKFGVAVESYERLLWLTDEVAGCEKESLKARTSLYIAYRKCAEEYEAKKDSSANNTERAIALYRKAKRFASGAQEIADVSLKLARLFEEATAWSEAVLEYQEIVLNCGGAQYADDDVRKSVKTHASARIADIVAQRGSGVYSSIEREAETALGKLDPTPSACVDFIGKYPNSKAAAGFALAAAERLSRNEQWKALLFLLRNIQQEHALLFDELSVRLMIVDALEHAGDWERLERELDILGDKFKGREVESPKGKIAIDRYVLDKRKVCVGKRTAAVPLTHPLKEEGSIGKMVPVYDGVMLAECPYPLMPSGVRPPFLAPSLEFFQNGSSIELRDLASGAIAWKIPHPGGFPGFFVKELGGKIVVERVMPSKKETVNSGDIIAMMDGTPLAADAIERFWRDVTSKPISSTLELTVMRNGKPVNLSVPIEPFPLTCRPAIVGAAFTRDYSLVVAWEDAVACFNTEKGAQRWMYGTQGSNRAIDALAVCGGTVLVGEIETPDVVWARREAQAPRTRPIVDALIGFSETTGELLWSRTLIQAAQTNPGGEWARDQRSRKDVITLFASDYSDLAAVQYSPLPNQMTLYLIDPNGNNNLQKTVTSIRGASLVAGDLENGRIAVAMSNANETVKVSCISIDRRINGKLGILWEKGVNNQQLSQWLASYGAVSSLVIGKNYAVLAVPTQDIVVFDISRSGEEFPIAVQIGDDKRNSRGVCALSPRDILYVYSFDQTSNETRLAYLSAYDLKTKKLLWDEPAPYGESPKPIIISGEPNFVVLFNQYGTMAGGVRSGPFLLLYSNEKSGALVMDIPRLAPINNLCVWLHRRKLYALIDGMVKVYGN